MQTPVLCDWKSNLPVQGQDRVDQVRPLSGDALIGEAVALGCLWAEQVCRALNWSWVFLSQGDKEDCAICPADRRFAILPISFMSSKLESEATDNTVVLLFNMLVAGNTPAVPPQSYHLLG